MKHLKLGTAIVAVAVAMFAAQMFSGVFVSPQTLDDYKTEHAEIEHLQSERMDAITTKHDQDMEKVHKMSEDVAGIKSTNEAILRELTIIRREMRQR